MFKTLIRRIPSAAVAALAAVTLGAAAQAPGVTPAPAASAASAAVNIDNFTFGPAALTVPVGTTVTWTNRDDIPHTLVAVDKSFRSKVLDTDEKFSFTFTQAGTYDYFCSIHPHMTGKVVVKAP
ncbi:MAG: cupredoxin domain-containing protein [Caulobacteraceae bacterium]